MQPNSAPLCGPAPVSPNATIIHELARVPRISIGVKARASLSALAASLVPTGSAVLLVADPGLAGIGITAEVSGLLETGRLSGFCFFRHQQRPDDRTGGRRGRQARAARATLLVALGGGSALDLGKAVAAFAGGRRPAEDLCALRRAPARRPAEDDLPAHNLRNRLGDDAHRHPFGRRSCQALVLGRGAQGRRGDP